MDPAQDYDGSGYTGGLMRVRGQAPDYCEMARSALVRAGGPFQNSTCQQIASTICGSSTLFRDGSELSNAILYWAGCGTAPAPQGGSAEQIGASFLENPNVANVSFSYAGPGGLISVNWWITKAGGKPRALGGSTTPPSGDEVAYKHVEFGAPPSSLYAEQNVQLAMDPPFVSTAYIGQYDSWIAVYQGTGPEARMLAARGFAGSAAVSAGGGGAVQGLLLGFVGVAALAGLAAYIASKGTKKVLVARIVR